MCNSGLMNQENLRCLSAHQNTTPFEQTSQDEARIAQYQKEAISNGIELPLLEKDITHAGLKGDAQQTDQNEQHRKLDKTIKEGFFDFPLAIYPARNGKQHRSTGEQSYSRQQQHPGAGEKLLTQPMKHPYCQPAQHRTKDDKKRPALPGWQWLLGHLGPGQKQQGSLQ